MNECKCLQRPRFCDCDIAKLEARIAELEKDIEQIRVERDEAKARVYDLEASLALRDHVENCLDERRSAVIAKMCSYIEELKRDAEELAARRWIDQYLWKTGKYLTVCFYAAKDKKLSHWRIDNSKYADIHFHGTGPEELARKLGWKP